MADDDVIRRGLLWELPDTPRGLEWAKKAEAQTLTAAEIVKALEPLGVWWGMESQYGGIAAYETHAEANFGTPAVQMLAEMREEMAAGYRSPNTEADNWFGGQIAVVLTAKRPRLPSGELWDPAIHNPPGTFLSGNSFLPDGQPLEITEVRYDATGENYVVLPARGIRATAAAGEVQIEDGKAWSEKVGGPMDKEALLGSRLWWRVHPEGREEILPELATSAPFWDGNKPYTGPKSQGYSAFDDPWHLYLYVWQMWGDIRHQHEVLGFSGTRVGTGHDGEDLVVPNPGGTVVRYRPEEFVAELLRTPFPQSPRFAPWAKFWPGAPSWLGLALHLRYLDQGDPVHEHIVESFAPAKAAASKEAGQYDREWGWEGSLDPGHPLVKVWPMASRLLPFAQKVAAAEGWDCTIEIKSVVSGSSRADYDYATKVATITLVPEHFTKWSVLHELAHISFLVHGDDEVAVYHGPQFEQEMLRLLKQYGGVDTSRFASKAIPKGSSKTASLPGGIEFTVKQYPNPEAKAIFAMLDDEKIGELSWYGSGQRYPEIQNVMVKPSHRRQGLATEMLRRAREIDPNLSHSTDLSDEGRAWRDAVGSKTAMPVGPTPDLTFEVKDGTWRGEPSGKRWLYAYVDGRRVGHLGWMAKPELLVRTGDSTFGPGEIIDVSVVDEWRRRGIASAMFRRAQQDDPRVHHSHALTDDGRAWSQAVASVMTAGRNGDLPEGIVFTDGKLGPDGPGYNPSRWIKATLDGRLIARMSWDPPYGMTTEGTPHPARIDKVEVSPSYRRRGVAMEMLRRAREITPGLEHSEQLTGDGRAWRNAVNPEDAGAPAYPMRMLPTISQRTASKTSLAGYPDNRGDDQSVHPVSSGEAVRGLPQASRRAERATGSVQDLRGFDPAQGWVGTREGGTLASGEVAAASVRDDAGGLRLAAGISGRSLRDVQGAPEGGGQRGERQRDQGVSAGGPLPRDRSGQGTAVYPVQSAAGVHGRLAREGAGDHHPGAALPVATSLPSWRDRGAYPVAEVVIVPDTGRARRNSYSVFLHGQPHARRPTLAEAKATVEAQHGDLTWEKVSGDTDPHHDPVWGPTSMFNDAEYFLVARLPQMKAAAASSGPEPLPMQYTVRVEFGRRRSNVQESPEGPMTPAYLDINAGERYVTVWARSDTEARVIATEMVAAGADSAQNPVGQTGDMPTRAEIVRVGTSKTAAGPVTVYRGVHIKLTEEDFDNLPGSLVSRVQKGGEDGTYRVHHSNLGVHWTTDKRVAQHFATPMTRRGDQPTLYSNGWDVFVPVVVTGRVSSADVVTDEEELRDAMVEGHGWNGIPSDTRLPEKEVLVRPGAQIEVTDIEALSPTQWWRVRQAWENLDAGRVQGFKAQWKRIGGGIRATAARNLPSGLRMRYDDLGGGRGRIVAFDDDNTSDWQRQYGIGMLSWNAQGVVSWVQVYEDEYQRRGVASAMWEEAKKHRRDLRHSDELSESGAAWSRTVAGRLPRLGSVPGLLIEEEWDLPSLTPGQRAVTARVNGKLVGGLIWTEADGIIDYVQVDADMRRKGIATALLEAARRLDPSVRHDVEENRSELGREWVRAVGSRTAAMTTKEIYSRTDRIRDHVSKVTHNEANDLLRKVLTDHGFPSGELAYTMPTPTAASSVIGWELDETNSRPPIPIVYLHRRSMTDLVLLHEAAHLLWLGGYKGPNHGFTAEQIHDQRWFSIWTDLIHRYANWATRYEFDRTFGLVDDPEWEKHAPLVMRAAKSIDMTEPKPEGWKGNGIYEMDISRWSTTGCVALLMDVHNMVWPLGWLTWDRDRFTIEGIYVNPEYRGKGIGIEMLKAAEKVAGRSLKNDSGEYTPEGLEWAKKRGIDAENLNPVSASDMARMIGQMNNLLIGGDLLRRQVQKVGSRRTARLGPQPVVGFDGPLVRRFKSYDDQSQRDIVKAMKALETGRLAEDPDPKRGPLKGLYTIPVGADSESSTPERLLVMPTRKGWSAVYYLPGHNYDQAERDIAGWQRALQRRQANLGYYATEWRWQAWAKSNGYGHLIEPDSLPNLRKAVQWVLDDHGVTVPLDIQMASAGTGYSEGGLIDGTAHVRLNPQEKNLWNALHEATHVVCDHKGIREPDGHGPGFRRLFSEVLAVHGGIDVDLNDNPPQRTAAVSATTTWYHGCTMRRAEEVARIGFPADYRPTEGAYGSGLYLTTNHKTANTYGDHSMTRRGVPGAIVTLTASPSNPLVVKAAEFGAKVGQTEEEIARTAREGDHDAIVIEFMRETWMVLLDPSKARYVSHEPSVSRQEYGKVASVKQASSGVIYRGLRAPFTDEIRHLLRDYEDREELPERRSAKVAKIILDQLESHRGRHSTGLGVHWSTRPEMADVAAYTGGNYGDWQVIVEATYQPSDVVPEGDDLYDLSAVWVGNQIEAEVLIKPGARLKITGLWVGDFIGTNVLSADRVPKMNVRGTRYYNILPAPEVRTAAAWSPYQPPAHIKITTGGDAVPGGYNGYFAAWDRATGEKMGYLDYQSGKYDGVEQVTIAMVEVEPKHRRKGVATVLLDALRHDFPDAEIDPGYTTADGAAWWSKVAGSATSAYPRLIRSIG